MNKSRLVQESKIYLQYDSQGNTSLTSLGNVQPGTSYRHIHSTHQHVERNGSGLFVDSQFKIRQSDISDIDGQNRKVILKRLSQLYNLYPKTQKPQFFPPKGYIPPKKLSKNPFLPAFATELEIFPVEHYKSFFITQDFQPNGLYEIVINQNGRFENDVVDDIVPVYQDSFEPIWGMDLDQSWQIILLKFWAKRNGGYKQVKLAPAFNFLQYFSDSNWKYYNLQKQAYDFLSFYTGKTNVGKFVLKTKSSPTIRQSGLINDSAGYQMINLVQTTPPNSNPNTNVNPRDRKWIATIRSTMVNKWTGSMSILDKQINNRYSPKQFPMALDRDFMVNESDFLNLFSSAYISSKRSLKDKKCVSDYYLLQIEPNIKTSIYLKFTIQKNTWFDFCVKQFPQNKIKPLTNKSVLKTQEYNKNQGIHDGKRYLKCRFILVKQNNQHSPSTFTDPEYSPSAYDTYEIQYLQGYNRGDARFLDAVKGDYILKIKPESVNKKSIFVVNYASDLPIKMHEYFPKKNETSLIMRQSMASLIGLLTSFHLNTERKDQQITFANVFEQIGYGFIGIRSKKICPYNILLQVDPQQLKTSGYKLKNQFKKITTPFSILIHPGQCTSIVLKKIPDVKYQWPPKGIEIFKQK